jgi:hypothetical protein
MSKSSLMKKGQSFLAEIGRPLRPALSRRPARCREALTHQGSPHDAPKPDTAASSFFRNSLATVLFDQRGPRIGKNFGVPTCEANEGGWRGGHHPSEDMG